VACGKGWIPRTKKCSRDKASQTSDEAKAKTVERAKARARLKGEVKAAKGQKAYVKPKPEPTPEVKPKKERKPRVKKGEEGRKQQQVPKTASDKYVVPKEPTANMTLIGSGVSGDVYLDSNANVAVKFSRNFSAETQNEISMMKEASALGVGPKFIGEETGANEGKIIAMEYLKGYSTLRGADYDYADFESAPRSVQKTTLKNIVNSFAKLADADIAHNDAHGGNIMIDFKTGDVKLIDMGLASKGAGLQDDLLDFLD
jgi:serine/threonine protein kinase